MLRARLGLLLDSRRVRPVRLMRRWAWAAALWGATLHAPAFAQSTPPSGGTTDAALGRGVTIRSADGQASMNLRVRVQVRGTVADGAEDDDATTEIGIRRMRLVLQGNALGPKLTYYVQFSFANQDSEPDLRLPLRDAYVTWNPAGSLNVRIGQMKVPFSRQRVVSSSALQMVDRSIVVSELNLDRDVGLQVFSRKVAGSDRVGYAVGVFGGEGRNRLGRAAGLLYSARLEAWPLGPFDDMVESDQNRRPAWRLAMAGNVGYNQRTNRPRSTIGTPYAAGDFSYRHAAVDAVLKGHGWSVQGEWLWRRADADARGVVVAGQPVTIRSRSGAGAYLQAGRMMSPRLEFSGRTSLLVPEPGTDPAFTRTTERTAGISYYVRNHDLKVQAEAGHLRDRAAGRTLQARVQLQVFF